MSYISFSDLVEKRLKAVRFHGATATGLMGLLAFILGGLVYNAISILRLPQSGLKTFEIVWVSLTACVIVILLALAMTAGLQHLGEWLTPKPPSEQWLREELRHRRIAAAHTTGEGKLPGTEKKFGDSSSAA